MKSFFGFLLANLYPHIGRSSSNGGLELVYRDLDMFLGILDIDGVRVQDSKSRMSHDFAQYFRRQVLQISTFARILEIICHLTNFQLNYGRSCC